MEIPRHSPGQAASSPPGAGRRDRERSARRQAMLDAAISVFAERGFAEATMDEIAERAEFGKGTLYNYFEDKQALLAAAFEEAYDGLVALVDEYFEERSLSAAVEALPTRQVFHGFIAHLTAYFQAHHSVFVVMMKEAHRLAFDGGGGHVAALLVSQRERVAAAIERPVAAAMRRGELRPLPARAVAHLIMGNVQGYLMNAACTSGVAPGPDMPDRTADFITTALFDGLLAEPR